NREPAGRPGASNRTGPEQIDVAQVDPNMVDFLARPREKALRSASGIVPGQYLNRAAVRELPTAAEAGHQKRAARPTTAPSSLLHAPSAAAPPRTIRRYGALEAASAGLVDGDEVEDLLVRVQELLDGRTPGYLAGVAGGPQRAARN